MLRLRVRKEFHPRAKKGAPPQSTTGAASASCSHAEARVMPKSCSNPEVNMPPILMATRGTVRARPTQKRRRILRSSPSSSSDVLSAATRDSSAVPQIGHDPGLSETTSGCIGQTYSVVFVRTNSGSRDIPHLGQVPGLSETTSGSIGQKYFVEACCGTAVCWISAEGKGLPKCTSGCCLWLVRYFSGSEVNLSAHAVQQKKYCLPSCSRLARARAGSTCIPHTGSTTDPGAGVSSVFISMI